jgi:hypothetical protein
MSGIYGNDNLAFVGGGQYLTVDGTSDNITLPVNVDAVDLYSTTDVWVLIGDPGETPVAAAPGAEKTSVRSFFLPSGVEKSGVPVPRGSAASLVKIAAIQSSAGGTLHATYRRIY